MQMRPGGLEPICHPARKDLAPRCPLGSQAIAFGKEKDARYKGS